MNKGVLLIHVHILLCIIAVVIVKGEAIGAAVAAVGAKKHVKGVRAAKEGGEGGMGVAMERVVVCRAARSP